MIKRNFLSIAFSSFGDSNPYLTLLGSNWSKRSVETLWWGRTDFDFYLSADYVITSLLCKWFTVIKPCPLLPKSSLRQPASGLDFQGLMPNECTHLPFCGDYDSESPQRRTSPLLPLILECIRLQGCSCCQRTPVAQLYSGDQPANTGDLLPGLQILVSSGPNG